jgi:hypothetical protein
MCNLAEYRLHPAWCSVRLLHERVSIVGGQPLAESLRERRYVGTSLFPQIADRLDNRPCIRSSRNQRSR